MVGRIVGAAQLVSGLLGLLGLLGTPQRRRAAAKAKREALVKGVPVYGTHYRFGGGVAGSTKFPGPRIEALCPDGEWRRFVWWTNTPNPWNGHHSRSDAEEAYWLADKFVGPTYLPRDGEAMSERGVRAAGSVGVWTLDPYCPDAHQREGYPYHGKGYPSRDDAVPPDRSWAGRLGEIRLLPCYETCGGK